MSWTEESKKVFDAAMLKEAEYAAAQYRAEQSGDFGFANFAYNMRWKLMDKAVASLVEEAA